jgi:hypothetical protein
MADMPVIFRRGLSIRIGSIAERMPAAPARNSKPMICYVLARNLHRTELPPLRSNRRSKNVGQLLNQSGVSVALIGGNVLLGHCQLAFYPKKNARATLIHLSLT